MHNYPYTTKWKDGKPTPILLRMIKRRAHQINSKETLWTWKMIYHGVLYVIPLIPLTILCWLSHFFANQYIQSEEGEEEKSHDGISCNIINLCDDGEESDLEEYEKYIVDQRNV